MIDCFNSISTYQCLFYAEMLGNRVHSTFIFRFLCRWILFYDIKYSYIIQIICPQLWFHLFFFIINDFQTDLNHYMDFLCTVLSNRNKF